MFSLSYKGRPVGFRRLLECVHEVDSRASPRTVVEMAPSRNKALPVEPGQRARLLKVRSAYCTMCHVLCLQTKKDGLVGLSVYLNSKQHMLQLTEDATPRSLLLEVSLNEHASY